MNQNNIDSEELDLKTDFEFVRSHKCVHVYGALNLMNGREIARTAPEQTASVTADFLRLLFPTNIS